MLHSERLEPLVAPQVATRTRTSTSTASATSASAPPPTTAAGGVATKKKKKKKAPYKDLERRREQNRVNAQKSYYRKLNVLDALRTEVAALEESYRAQMQTLKSDSTRFPDDAAPQRSPSRLDSASAHEERGASLAYPDAGVVADFDMENAPRTIANYRRQLQHLATEHSALKDEHRMLQQRHDLHVKFQCRVQLLMDSEHRVSVEELFGAESEARRAKVLAELRARCPAQMRRPLDVNECHAIGRDVYAKIQAFAESEKYTSTGGAVCGWEDRRCVEDGLLKFSLQKLFPNVTAREMAARTWPVLASPAKLRSFYSNNMKMHCEVAQRVDDSNVVLYQEYEAKERDPVTGRETDALVLVRSLLLVTLFQINDGFVMLFHGIDPSRLQERDEAETLASVGVSDRKVWLNKLSWCIWQEVGDAGEHTSSAFVGAVPADSTSSFDWPLEVLLMSMRWEHEVVGSNFILRCEDDPEPPTHPPAPPAVLRYSSVRFGSWTQLPPAPHDPSRLAFRGSMDNGRGADKLR